MFRKAKYLVLIALLSSCAISAQEVDSFTNIDTSSLASDTLQNIKDTTISIRDTTIVTNLDSLNSTVDSSKAKPKRHFERQLRFGVDLIRPISSFVDKSHYGVELMADYTYRPETYFVLEGGYGGGKVDYTDLQYQYSNIFLKLGAEQSMFDAISKDDWDIITLGLRYGIGFGRRGEANYIISNPFGQGVPGSTPARGFVVHCGEIVAGMRMEVLPRIFVGWTVRAKFLLNGESFQGQAAPNYIAGYGKGDKSTVFDGNFYVMYAIRWFK